MSSHSIKRLCRLLSALCPFTPVKTCGTYYFCSRDSFGKCRSITLIRKDAGGERVRRNNKGKIQKAGEVVTDALMLMMTASLVYTKYLRLITLFFERCYK